MLGGMCVLKWPIGAVTAEAAGSSHMIPLRIYIVAKHITSGCSGYLQVTPVLKRNHFATSLTSFDSAGAGYCGPRGRGLQPIQVGQNCSPRCEQFCLCQLHP